MTEPVGFRFSRRERVRSAEDVRRIFQQGRRYSCRGMRLVVRKNGQTYNRVVCAPTRAFDTAVYRNRVRRVAREIYRTHKHLITPGNDLAVVLFPGDFSFEQRTEQMMYLFRAAGIRTSGD